MPEAVAPPKKEGDGWFVDVSVLVPLLVKEVQDLGLRVASLEK